MWHPREEEAGVMRFSPVKAVAAGLTYRPIERTVRDVLAWDASLPSDRELAAGMTPEREAPLLEAWRTRGR
jgi:2'-hydroxyisoflavone reductase